MVNTVKQLSFVYMWQVAVALCQYHLITRKLGIMSPFVVKILPSMRNLQAPHLMEKIIGNIKDAVNYFSKI